MSIEEMEDTFGLIQGAIYHEVGYGDGIVFNDFVANFTGEMDMSYYDLDEFEDGGVVRVDRDYVLARSSDDNKCDMLMIYADKLIDSSDMPLYPDTDIIGNCIYDDVDGYGYSFAIDDRVVRIIDANDDGSIDNGCTVFIYFDNENSYCLNKCKEYVTMRAQPSTDAADICRIYAGAVLEFISDADNGFCKVRNRGDEGYILKKYISRLDSSEIDGL